ncbi:MAG: Uncharacterized protein CEN89_152 [Candidatus Berkelbacteria bacterium Licking1014_7]|uniref:Uncharacterized protein n=1 Tax=Candidatus Berkelbacteria bacterium Licking1014_7 TaxID=2017147 RepID=A0A554LK75_9BACT|nr:MAG: Uncharacterized protein CEN89_152 [Candidatus Berkelbacteria bacterium Licking1014_7]
MKLSAITGTGNTLLPTKPDQVQYTEVSQIVNVVFNTVIIAAGAIFVILLLVGGIQYLSGAGNEEATGKSKKLMIDAVVGLIIVLAAWAIGTWVKGQFGL